MKPTHKFIERLRERFPMMDPAPSTDEGRVETVAPSAPVAPRKKAFGFITRLRERFPMIDPLPEPGAADAEPAAAPARAAGRKVAFRFILRLRERLPMIDPVSDIDAADPLADQLTRHMRERFPLADAPATPAPARTRSRLGRLVPRLRFFRGGGRNSKTTRALHGGRVRDYGRLPRYALIMVFGLGAIWGPVVAYLKFAPIRYTSELALILPGAGVSTSVNLSEIGQASTSANSPYSSPSLSPTVLYKNLLESFAVISRAAELLDLPTAAVGKPVIKLVDETSLIHVSMTGKSPEDAHDRAEAIHQALLSELDKLRDDEIKRREAAAIDTIKAYQDKVEDIRAKISELQLRSGLNSAEQYSGIVTSTETLQIHVAEVRSSLEERERSLRSLLDTLHVSSEIAAATLKAHADPTLGALSSAVAKDAAETAELERTYGPKHPKYLAAQARYESVRDQLRTRGAAITGLSPEDFADKIDMNPSGERVVLLARVVTLVLERDGLASQFKTQSEDLAKSRERVRALVEVASQLDTLNRDYKVADAVFASALARINTSKADLFASYPMIQIAEPATMPEKPSSPNKIIAAAAGGGGSVFLLIGLGLAWVRRPLIDKILARREIQHEPARA